jgi:hypothetical protein
MMPSFKGKGVKKEEGTTIFIVDIKLRAQRDIGYNELCWYRRCRED